jgi:hypothetical protein
MRNNQRSGVFGTLGQGVQRGADLQSGLLGTLGNIQSSILPITTQMAMQNAQLAGQKGMLGAQNALNAFTTLGGMQSQNLMAQQLGQESGGADPAFGKGMFDSIGNLIRGFDRRRNPGAAASGADGNIQSPTIPSGIAGGINPLGGPQRELPQINFFKQFNPQCPSGYSDAQGNCVE